MIRSCGIAALIACGLAGCGSLDRSSATAPVLTETIKDATRVFMHERGRFSVMVPSADGKGQHMMEVECYSGYNCSEFVMDAPADGPMYVTGEWKQDYGPERWRYCQKIVFHLHEQAEVEGGGWQRRERHGKHSTTVNGTTVVIE